MSTGKTVARSKLSNIAMVNGNEKDINIIIHDGRLKEWVGIGWIDIGKPTEEDYKTYPITGDDT